MKIEYFVKFDIVTPDEGMVLTNGESVSECLYTPCGADLSAWQEVTKAEGERILSEHQPEL